FIMLFLLEGRAGFLNSLFLILLYILKRFTNLSKKLLFVVGAIVVAVLSVVVVSHDRMSVDDMQQNPRFVLWKYALECISEKPILGYGVSDGEERFISKCMASDEGFMREVLPQRIVDFKDSIGFHTHSIFLQSMLEFGIIGLLLQIFILILPFYNAIKRKDFLLMSFCLLFAVQGVFEVWGVGLLPTLFSLLMLITLRGANVCHKDL
ncbi:MAG: O-antigen ligase family protein, partial [Paludibacteraceae bacterium]|nr:O-antigen ligase family protein [Paludibacteraceae bacterium]